MLRPFLGLFLAFGLSGCIGTLFGITKDVVVGTASIATDVVVGSVDITTDVIGLALPGGGDDDDDD